MGTSRLSHGEIERQALDTFSNLTEIEHAGELVAVIQRLSLARSLTEIQQEVRSAARRLTGADGATFVLREDEYCYYVDEEAIGPLWKGQRFPVNHCVSGWAILNRSPVVIEDIRADPRIPEDLYRPTFVKSLAVVPIRRLDPIGAIGNYWSRPRRPSSEEVALLQALADSTAVAMENVRGYEELENARLETLHRLALAAEFRDDATHEHTRRVARIACMIAERLELGPDDVDRLRQAAPLHDIGKLAVADAILLKPGRLTVEEFEIVKGHASAGAAILAGSTSDVLRLAEEIAITHHEWWDGSGYPHGLADNAIPLSGRIVAVADVFDALTHARPYKPAWPVDDSLAEIHRLRAAQFDPEIVDAFEELDPHEFLSPAPAEPQSVR